jgi:hypothetical protein
MKARNHVGDPVAQFVKHDAGGGTGREQRDPFDGVRGRLQIALGRGHAAFVLRLHLAQEGNAKAADVVGLAMVRVAH